MCSRPRSSRSSRPRLPKARSSTPTNTASTPAWRAGAISTKRSAMPGPSMRATKTATGSARCTSTPSKASGLCCAPGCGRTAVFRRTSCRFTSASSSSCTTYAVAAKPSSARSLPPWSHDPPDQHPGSQQEPRRFAKEPRSDKDLHRPVSEHDQLDEAFAWKEDRTVSNSLTLQYDHVLIILEPNAVTRPLARQRVTVFDYPDGRLAIKHKGLELPYRTFDKRQRVNQAAVVENKRLGPVLAYIAERQKELDLGRSKKGRSKKAPRRRGQGPSLFKVG